MCEVTDYQLWKSVWLVKPTRTVLYDIVLALGGDNSTIEFAEQNLKKYFIDNLSSEDFYRFCLFNILLKLRNKNGGGDLFYAKIHTVFNNLGFNEINQILH